VWFLSLLASQLLCPAVAAAVAADGIFPTKTTSTLLHLDRAHQAAGLLRWMVLLWCMAGSAKTNTYGWGHPNALQHGAVAQCVPCMPRIAVLVLSVLLHVWCCDNHIPGRQWPWQLRPFSPIWHLVSARRSVLAVPLLDRWPHRECAPYCWVQALPVAHVV